MKRIRKHALNPVALAWVAASVAQAQTLMQADSTSPEARVEVVGVSPVPGLRVPLDQVPANVQVVRARDLAASQAGDVSEFASRRLTSVHVNEIQGNAMQVDLGYRGFSVSPLLGSQQGLSLYMDGVRLNQPFGDVVSWDVLPRLAISQLVMMPGSNPLFGLNTLGGALAVQTKDGQRFKGTEVQGTVGRHGALALEAESGSTGGDGWHRYVAGRLAGDMGWRVDSRSEQAQLFGKLGRRQGDAEWALSAAVAASRLNGNGLQDYRFLEQDWSRVYTRPDQTRNRALLVNATWQQPLSAEWSFSGNAYLRAQDTRTFNGDLNDDSLDQATVQPSAAERAALTAAGYSGFPTSGETAANTPFPKWRCIGQVLLVDEPAEKCNGLINRTHTRQGSAGVNLQLQSDAPLFGLKASSLVGAALDRSRAHFVQSSELGYLNADLTVTGVGAFGDEVTGGNVDGAPYDTRVDLTGTTLTTSVFASSTVRLAPGLHLTAAARWNRHQVRNRDAISPGGGSGSLDSDSTYSRLNPGLGLTFSPLRGLNFFGGVNQGSRAPSSVELGCSDPANPCKLPNAFASDPPLRQVVTTSVEAGVRGTQRGTEWSLALFRADNRDDLLFVADNTSGFGYFRNFGKTRRQGLEATVRAKLNSDWTLGAGVTWLDATFQSEESLPGAANSSNDAAAAGLPGVEGTIDIEEGSRIPQVPRQQLKLFAEWRPLPRWQLALDVTAMGRTLARGNENGRHQPDGVYYLGSGANPGFALANLSVNFQQSKGLEWFGLVRNLFDRRYTTAAQLGATGFDSGGGFQSRPFPANANGDRPLRYSTFFAPGAPRALQMGLRWRFDSL